MSRLREESQIEKLMHTIPGGCCLYAWFEGQLPDSLHLYFRQPDCLESTAIVSFFVPARRSDENYEQSKGLVIAYVRQPLYKRRYGY